MLLKRGRGFICVCVRERYFFNYCCFSVGYEQADVFQSATERDGSCAN